MRQGQLSPLALALLAALALHLLVLSALPLRQRRQAPATEPLARDDTPELLLFSRQQSQEPAISTLSISSLAQLPPPPPLAPPALSPPPTAQRPPLPGQQRSDLAIRPTKRQSSATAAGKPGRSATASRPGGTARPVPHPTLKTALAALPALQAGSGSAATAGSEPGWPAAQKAQADELTIWTRLWEKARPAAKERGQAEALPSGTELRWLPIAEGDGTPWPPSRRLSLTLGDRLLLVWSSGQELWLLQAPALRPEADGEPQGT